MSHLIPPAHAGNVVFLSVVEHFDRHGLRFAIDSDQPIVRFSMKQSQSTCQCAAYVSEEGDLFIFRAALPTYAPEAVRPAVSETVTRANYGMKVGSFEMDFSDGEICFRTYAVCEGQPLADAVLGRLVGCALAMCERYLPAFVSVMYSHAAPEAAIAEVESSPPHAAGRQLDNPSVPGPARPRGDSRLARNFAAEFLRQPPTGSDDDEQTIE